MGFAALRPQLFRPPALPGDGVGFLRRPLRRAGGGAGGLAWRAVPRGGGLRAAASSQARIRLAWVRPVAAGGLCGASSSSNRAF